MRLWHLVLAAVLGLGIIGAGSTYAAPRHSNNAQLVKKPGKHKHHHKKHGGKHKGQKKSST
jgi:hypothetical protein